MIRHVVCWKLYDEAQGNSKRENSVVIKEQLLNLKNRIPQIQNIEVGINYEKADLKNYDIVLVADFESIEGLKAYQKHPAHKEFVQFIHPLRSDKIAVDYER